MDDILTIPVEVCERLGFYVYLLIDPRTHKPFYVGKGQKSRILAHLLEDAESRKVNTIRELRGLGLEPRLEILTHQLSDEEAALRVEAAVIDLLGLGALSNKIRGWRSIQFGRIGLREAIMYYSAKPVDIDDPVILIRISKLYRHNMSADELYDVTRGIWGVGPNRDLARYALAVFEGVVREVYSINRWEPVIGFQFITNIHHIEQPELLQDEDRWVFTGAVSENAIRSKYIGRSVASYFKKGNRRSFIYVNI